MADSSTKLVYGVHDQPRSWRDTALYSFQWLATMFYGVVWGYAIVGLALGFEGEALLGYMAAIVLVTGVSTFVQSLAGHGFAMVSGPNVIPSLAIAAIAATEGPEYAQQAFMAQAIAGAGICLLALFGVLNLIKRIWSPLILGAMVLMVGLAIAGQGLELLVTDGFDWTFWAALALALAGIVLSIRGRNVWGTLSPLLIIAGGYLVFVAGGQIDWELVTASSVFVVPEFLPYGFEWPPIDLILIIALANLMAAMNMYGNVTGYAEVVNEDVPGSRVKRMFSIFGAVETALPGLFGAPATVPYGENLGIIATTRVAARRFILIAAGCFIVLAFLGPVVGLMAAMPDPVAGAVLLGIASTAIGIGVNIMTTGIEFGSREQAVVGFSVFLALGLSQLPEEIVENTPQSIAVLLDNPIVSVILFVVFFEQIALRKKSASGNQTSVSKPNGAGSDQ